MEEPDISLTRSDLVESIHQRAKMASSDFSSLDDIKALLQRSADRRRTKIAEGPQELNSLDVSTIPTPHEYSWDDLVAGTNLPTPYYNPEDPIIKLDESQFVSIEETLKAHTAQPTKKVVPTESTSLPGATKKSSKQASTLSTHFDLPRTNLTPELKRDLQLLHMRDVLDPKRQYKKQGKFKIPEYSQVGTIVEGPTEFFSSRLSKQDRNRTFVEEALANESQSGRFKARYSEAQERKKSGKKNYYKKLLARRRDGWSKSNSQTKSRS